MNKLGIISRNYIKEAIDKNKITILSKSRLAEVVDAPNSVIGVSSLSSFISSESQLLFDCKHQKEFDLIFRGCCSEIKSGELPVYEAAERTLFWLSVYYNYPYVAYEESAYELLHYALKEKLVF